MKKEYHTIILSYFYATKIIYTHTHIQNMTKGIQHILVMQKYYTLSRRIHPIILFHTLSEQPTPTYVSLANPCLEIFDDYDDDVTLFLLKYMAASIK